MRVVVVPSTLALLPQYASREDPIAELRRAVATAVDWLLAEGPASISAATPAARRIGVELLGERHGSGSGVLVVANGSASRTEKAPGHLDPRAEGFDAAIGRAFAQRDLSSLGAIDLELAGELGVIDAPVLAGMSVLTPAEVEVDYDAAPYGVQYWVVRLVCGP